MMKLITHNDLDGIGCEIITKLAIPNIEVRIAENHNVNDIILEELENLKNNEINDLLITDLHPNEEIAEILDYYEPHVIVIDHHENAKYINNYNYGILCVKSEKGLECGTSLLYNHYKYIIPQDEILLEFIELVRQYDTWEWNTKYDNIKAKQLNDLFIMFGRKKFVDFIIDKITNEKPIFDESTKTLLKVKENEIINYINRKEKDMIIKRIGDYNVGIVMGDCYNSELGNVLCTRHSEIDYIAIIKQKTISLRCTKDDVNLTEIAMKYGGGGHRKASGFTLTKDKLNNFITTIFE